MLASPDNSPVSLSGTSDNPFRASRIRPQERSGAITPATLERLIQRLRKNQGWGQIVGPHGSGKTTLLLQLMPALQETGWEVTHFAVAPGRQTLDDSEGRLGRLHSQSLLVIDGFGQLTWRGRRRIRRRCQRLDAGLLVTTHQSSGLPDLCRTAPSLQKAQQLTAELMSGYPPLIDVEDTRQCFHANGANLREMFFSLYDLYEERIRKPPKGVVQS